MNIRYVVVLCGLILLLVGALAGEGGPLDEFSGGRSPVAAPAPDPSKLIIASATPPANVAIGDYEPEEPAAASFVDVGIRRDPRNLSGTRVRGTPEGALSDAQLGVEVPVGLASLSMR